MIDLEHTPEEPGVQKLIQTLKQAAGSKTCGSCVYADMQGFEGDCIRHCDIDTLKPLKIRLNSIPCKEWRSKRSKIL